MFERAARDQIVLAEEDAAAAESPEAVADEDERLRSGGVAQRICADEKSDLRRCRPLHVVGVQSRCHRRHRHDRWHAGWLAGQERIAKGVSNAWLVVCE